MTVPSLDEYPLREVQAVESGRAFLVRVEKNLPSLLSEEICRENFLTETKKAKLYSLDTDQRTLGYILRINGRPRIRLGWNYVFAFYGRKLSSVRINYQDSNVRLIVGGNGRFVALVVRPASVKKDGTQQSEEEIEED